MNNEHQTYHFQLAKVEQAVNPYLQRFADLSHKTQYEHHRIILRFLSYVRNRGKVVDNQYWLTHAHIMTWMQQIARSVSTDTAALQFSCVNEFLQAMVLNKTISGNPLVALRTHFGQRGSKGLAWANQTQSIRARLESLRIKPPFTGDFGRHAQRYVDLHRAAGRKYCYTERLLAEVNRFLCKQSISSVRSVSANLLQTWIHSMTCNQSSRRKKVTALKRFFDHLCSFGVVPSNPITPAILDAVGPRQQRFEPFIYSLTQIRDLLTVVDENIQ